MKQVITIALAALLASAACGEQAPAADKTPEQVLKEHGAALETKAVALDKLAKTPLPTALGTIKVAGPPLVQLGMSHKAPGNTAFMFEDDLKDLMSFPRVELRNILYTQLVNDCYAIVRNKTMAAMHAVTYTRDATWDGSRASEQAPLCTAMRYVIVIKLIDFANWQYVDKDKFGGGSAKAQAYVYDLETGAYAGGVEFEAGSSGATHDPRADLWINFYKALVAAVKAQLRDATLGI